MNTLSIHKVTKITLDDAKNHTLSTGEPYAVRGLKIETEDGTFRIDLFAADIADLGIPWQ